MLLLPRTLLCRADGKPRDFYSERLTRQSRTCDVGSVVSNLIPPSRGKPIAQGNPTQELFLGYGGKKRRQFLYHPGKSQVPIIAPLLGYRENTKNACRIFFTFYYISQKMRFPLVIILKFYIGKRDKS